MAYYRNKLADAIGELEDVDNNLSKLSDELAVLEGIDWDEVFEDAPNGQQYHKEITDTIRAIADLLEDITGR